MVDYVADKNGGVLSGETYCLKFSQKQRNEIYLTGYYKIRKSAKSKGKLA